MGLRADCQLHGPSVEALGADASEAALLIVERDGEPLCRVGADGDRFDALSPAL
jgi:hypothetical protein